MREGWQGDVVSLHPLDTDPRIARMQVALLRRATVARRLAGVRSMTRTVLDLSRRAIRRAHPELGEEEVALRFVALYYGADLARRVRDHLSGNTR